MTSVATTASASTATPDTRVAVSVSDASGWVAVATLADGERSPALGSVFIAYASGEMRAVATDARVLAVSRIFDPDHPEPGTSTKRRLHAVNAAPRIRPAGHVGVTGFRPRKEVAVSAAQLSNAAAFLKDCPSREVVEVAISQGSLTFTCGESVLTLPVVSQNMPDYQKIFSDVIAASRPGTPAPLNLNADQLVRLMKSAGVTTAAARKKMTLHVEGFMMKKEESTPAPLRVDVMNEEVVFGPHRRWVGLVAPFLS